MSQLSQFACSPVSEDEPALTPEELENLLPLVPSWLMVQEAGGRKLRAHYTLRDAKQTADFVEMVGDQARAERHPVELQEEGTLVRVTCHTPLLGGLHPNDFIMAARVDGVWSQVIVGHKGKMDRPGRLPTLGESPRFRRILSPLRHRD